MRTVKKVHKAEYRPIADLITYSPLPTASLSQIDPFIFLNHHGFQTYSAHNKGLPFGPHPHRGMETVTFIIEGDIMHRDSNGNESIINAGGVQWMTAGSGLIHAEVSSTDFKRNGGDLEILQMWLNLPAKDKMTAPFYAGLQKEEIPQLNINDKVRISLIAGKMQQTDGAFNPLNDIFLCTASLKQDASWNLNIVLEKNIFFYVVRGKVNVNGSDVVFRNLVEFNNDNENLEIKADKDSLIILGYAAPFNEPIVAKGPFVMNTEAEIAEAYSDYQAGKFGIWKG